MTNVFDDSSQWRQRMKMTESHVGGRAQLCSWDEQNVKTKIPSGFHWTMSKGSHIIFTSWLCLSAWGGWIRGAFQRGH